MAALPKTFSGTSSIFCFYDKTFGRIATNKTYIFFELRPFYSNFVDCYRSYAVYAYIFCILF